jgi:cation diffusion facilitator family transporter
MAMEQSTTREKRALLVALVSQIIISAIKVGYGYHAAIVSMKADGFHSFFDAASSVVGLVGVRFARKPPDADHPYGHGKFEYISTMGISLLLFYTAYQVWSESYARFFSGVIPRATTVSFLIILATMLVNYTVYRYQMRTGKEIGSQILVADATHTKSDIWASFAVIVALISIRGGFPLLDPICAILIVFLIIWVGYRIVKESLVVLTDSAIIDSQKVKEVALATAGVRGCHRVRTRGTIHHIHLDLHLEVDSSLDTREGHDVVHEVERRIRNAFRGVHDVMIHVEPHE